jgi:hypothetical protein
MTDLLDWTPPTVFHGETFDQHRDGARLSAQAERTYNVMKSGAWQTLASLSMVTGDPQASVSARIRDLRKAGYTVEREYVSRGLWRYRMVVD